jgi:hypothetical protein
LSAEDLHDAWALWMLGQDRDHSSIKRFEELNPATRRQDLPFVEASRAVVSGRS